MAGESRAGSGPDGYLSIAVRALLNAEAVNMVESTGNVTRRRSVPVIYSERPGKYVLRWVPAISGEALAHAYQKALVEKALESKECRNNVDFWSKQGEFLKHFDLKFYKIQCTNKNYKTRPYDWECELANACVKENEKGGGKSKKSTESKTSYDIYDIEFIEKIIVCNSIVEDIGGFLVQQGPTRRTSRIRFSMALPTADNFDAAQIDMQMHVRSALKAESLKFNHNTSVMLPYYVQVASALYGFNMELDITGIGKPSNCLGDKCELEYIDINSLNGCKTDKVDEMLKCGECNREKRVALAIEALQPILELRFGAKRSRNMPHGKLELAVAVVSDKPFPMPSAMLSLNGFIDELVGKLVAYKGEGGIKKIVILASKPLGSMLENAIIDKCADCKDIIKYTETVPEFVREVKEAVLGT